MMYFEAQMFSILPNLYFMIYDFFPQRPDYKLQDLFLK